MSSIRLPLYNRMNARSVWIDVHPRSGNDIRCTDTAALCVGTYRVVQQARPLGSLRPPIDPPPELIQGSRLIGSLPLGF